jgi:hypothetical protein
MGKCRKFIGNCLVPEFYADRDSTKADKQDTLNKPQIVSHETEETTYLAVF